jgi:hypothetical protein
MFSLCELVTCTMMQWQCSSKYGVYARVTVNKFVMSNWGYHARPSQPNYFGEQKVYAYTW